MQGFFKTERGEIGAIKINRRKRSHYAKVSCRGEAMNARFLLRRFLLLVGRRGWRFRRAIFCGLGFGDWARLWWGWSGRGVRGGERPRGGVSGELGRPTRA